MRVSTIAAGLCLLAALPPGLAFGADLGGVSLYPDAATGTPVAGPESTSLIDAWNDTQPYAPVGSYAAQCFGFAYVPSQDYMLERIEFYAGGLAGTVTVSVHQDVGDGHPTGPVLGSVTYGESATLGWQGASLVPSVPLTAGVTYYIKYMPVGGAPTSTADGGTIIPHSWADFCVSWNGPGPFFFWMARFHGSAPTATEPSSWGMVKRLYR
jgi:hypothetical protein